MKKRLRSQVLALAILTPGLVSGQQTIAPPPKATVAASNLAVTMRALEQRLRSLGRMSWTQNIIIDTGAVERKAVWEEISSVIADPTECELKVVWQTGTDPKRASAYLEEISGVDVLTSDKFIHLNNPLRNARGEWIEENVDPPLISVGVNSWQAFDFKFATGEAADQIAGLLREAVKLCSAVPAKQPKAGLGAPGLAETLNFIADKMSSQGHVRFVVTSAYSSTEGKPADRFTKFTTSVNYVQVSPSPTTCTMDISNNVAEGDTFNNVLSLRRIEKIELMSAEKYFERLSARSGLPEGHFEAATPIFVLVITPPDGDPRGLYFADEMLGDRVAKAMLHAAELCGAGTKKEAF